MLLQRVFPLRCRSLRRLRVANFSGNMQHGGYSPERFVFFPKTTISLPEFLPASLFHLPLHPPYSTTAVPKRTFSSALVSAGWRAQRENDRRKERGIWAGHSKRIVGPT